jgi:hypothetical protein
MLKGKSQSVQVEDQIKCAMCGTVFLWTHPKGGKPRKYCSGACRECARRHREDWPEVKAALSALATAAACLPALAGELAFARVFLLEHSPRRIQRR